MQFDHTFDIITPVQGTGITIGGHDGIVTPTGTTAQRPGANIAGITRFNSDLNTLEFNDGTTWRPVSTGAVGGAANRAFFENEIHVTVSYTITSGYNAMSAGPITVDSGVVVTVPSGSVWTVV